MAAVAAVNEAIEKMNSDGDLREMNRAFKEARRADQSVRFYDYVQAKKVEMLQAMAGSEM